MNESCCSIHGCVTITATPYGCGMSTEATPIDGGIQTSANRLGGLESSVAMVGGMTTDVMRVGYGLKVNTTILCRPNQGEWEFFFVREGQLYDVNNEKILVRREKNV